MIDTIFLVFEVIFELVILVLIILSLIYYFSVFIEERMKTMTIILKTLNIVILILSLFLLFSSFSKYLCISIIVANSLWLLILFTDFPYICLYGPNFLLAVLVTIISHVLMMMHFIKHDEVSSITTASYFILYVWILPILIIISLDAILEDDFTNENEGENETQSEPKTHSYVRLIFTDIINKVTEILPHNADKCD